MTTTDPSAIDANAGAIDAGGGFGTAWSAAFARATDTELDAWLDFALRCADLADGLALRHFRRDLEVVRKPDRTFVTQADRAIERAVRERIAGTWPDHAIVGEEEGAVGASRTRWWIDPIDGTANFIRGVPIFGFLLALEHDGELQLGVISMPALGERWFARRGGGAWRVATGIGGPGPRRIGVSAVERMEDAQLVFGSAADLAATGRVPGFAALGRQVWRDRGFGDCWGYALVAEGAAEAMVEADLHAWDLAAPAVVVEEAGGRLTDLAGRRRIDGGSALATNGRLHEDFLEALTTAPSEG